MANILLVKSHMQLSRSQFRAILDQLKAQKETGVILLMPYLEAKIIPDDIEIKLVDEKGESVE